MTLRLHERRWNTCPQCGNRGFRETIGFMIGRQTIQCLSCHHMWQTRSGGQGQISKKARPLIREEEPTT